MRRRLLAIAAALVLLACFAVFVVPTLLEGTVRRGMERKANARLRDYSLHIGRVRLHPLRLAVELLNTTIVQAGHPDPPMARIPDFQGTIHWRALLKGRLVADILFDRPELHITTGQATQEIHSPVPVQHKGWQEALLAIYPLKVNVLRIRDGEVVYQAEGPYEPLHLTRVHFRAENIRNVFSPERVYPSDLSLDAVVFGSGGLHLTGAANFLAVPYPGMKGSLELDQVELAYFKPLLHRLHLEVKSGTLSTEGEFEYAPTIRKALLHEVTLDRAELQYSHGAPAAPTGEAAHAVSNPGSKVAEKAKAVSNEPQLDLRLDRLHVTRSSVGYVDAATAPPYLLYVNDLNLDVENLSNQAADGVARATLRGLFMGSGPATATAGFRPRAKQLDLALDVRIENTDMAKLNNLFRAYGKFDVQGGQFSLYSEIRIRDGRVQGYVKPLFQHVHVYDPAKDRHKPLGKRLYERVVGAVSHLLENRPRHEVATVADLSGPVHSPNASTLQVVARLVQNAFFKAILPGFQREVGGA